MKTNSFLAVAMLFVAANGFGLCNHYRIIDYEATTDVDTGNAASIQKNCLITYRLWKGSSLATALTHHWAGD